MKGYKAFDKNLRCRGYQFEIGKEYKHDGKITICESGFHFCKSLIDCYVFYPMSEETRICEVDAIGEIVSDEDGVKYCTNRIKILSEVKNPKRKSNLSDTSSGYMNSGYMNSGNGNSGSRNSGNWNSGNGNSGSENSGDNNSGNMNSGSRNSGSENSGNWNSGNGNSGNRNSGNGNSGSENSGNWNSGNWNSGNWNSGIFNTEKNPKIKIFDTLSDWTINDWYKSDAYRVMCDCPYTNPYFINKDNMTDEERKQKWWDGLSEADKQAVYDLPNFDANKFEMCTEIKIRR